MRNTTTHGTVLHRGSRLEERAYRSYRYEVVILITNRGQRSCKRLYTVDDALRQAGPVLASSTLAILQRVGGSTDCNSEIIGCESHKEPVQPTD